jgi:hypothetical protein
MLHSIKGQVIGTYADVVSPHGSHHEAQKSNAKECVDVLPEAVSLFYRDSNLTWLSALHSPSAELLQTENVTQSKYRLALLCHPIISQHMREGDTLEDRGNFEKHEKVSRRVANLK